MNPGDNQEKIKYIKIKFLDKFRAEYPGITINLTCYL